MSEQTEKNDLERVSELCSRNLNEIAAYFEPSVKLTLVARTPNEPGRDFILSTDDLDAVATACHRRKDQMPKGASEK